MIPLYVETCPKCALGHMSSPRYNEATDTLTRVCTTCGYRTVSPPADRKHRDHRLADLLRGES